MKTVKWSEIATQLIAASGVMVLVAQVGIMEGWISPNMARLTAANATIPLTLSEASWLPSCLKLGKMVSVIFVPILVESVGSKNTILFTFIPATLAWVLTMTAKTAMLLYVSRILCGITACWAFSCYPIYLSEISSPSFRGTFLAIAAIGWPLGTLIGSIAETYLREVESTTMYLVPCILGMFLFKWLPDSPYRLVKNQRMGEAAESLAWYRGHKKVEVEMEEIVEFVESSRTAAIAEKMKELRSPTVRKAILLVSLVNVLPHVCGVANVFYYTEIIVTNGKSHLVDPSQIAIYTNVISLFFKLVTLNLLDKLGRRIVLITSCAVMAVALLVLGVHFYLLNNVRVDPVNIQWLPIASIITLMVTFAVGQLPVMNVLVGEFFPASVKSTAAMIVTLAASLIAFVSTKFYQLLIDAIGESYVFCMYAVFMALSIPIFCVFLPETKGKSLQEIQKFLNEK